MKRIHLLRTTLPAEGASALIGAVAAAGLRSGWLDLTGVGAWPGTTGLDRATDAGALRAVGLEEDRSVTVERAGGPPVLRDLLRKHFLGCAVVLIRVAEGDAPPRTRALAAEIDELPRLEPAGEGWRVVLREGSGGAALGLTGGELVARLRRPRPWS